MRRTVCRFPRSYTELAHIRSEGQVLWSTAYTKSVLRGQAPPKFPRKAPAVLWSSLMTLQQGDASPKDAAMREIRTASSFPEPGTHTGLSLNLWSLLGCHTVVDTLRPVILLNVSELSSASWATTYCRDERHGCI